MLCKNNPLGQREIGNYAMAETLSREKNNGNSGAASTTVHSQARLPSMENASVTAHEVVPESMVLVRCTRWLAIATFTIVLYDGTCLVVDFLRKSPPVVQVFCMPLFTVVVAGVTFWRRQVWKLRSKAWQAEAAACRNSVNSLAQETTNEANAIRASLTALQESNTALIFDEHLQQVDRALARIDLAVNRSALRAGELNGEEQELTM